MKPRISIISALLCGLLISACAPSPAPSPNNSSTVPTATPTPAQTAQAIQNSLPYIRASASIVTAGVLASVKNPAQRATDAAYINDAAIALNALSTGTMPTAAQIQQAVSAATKKSKDSALYASIAVSIANIYQGFYPQIQQTGNPALAGQVVQQIALGLQDSSTPYLTSANPPVATLHRFLRKK